MKAFPFLAAAFFSAALALAAAAADDPIRISVSAEPVRLPPGSVFTLTVTIEGAGLTSLPEPRLGRLVNFEILGTSKNQQVSLVNGEMSVTKSVVYRVRALKEGVYDIPPASAVYEGAVYQTNPITITVDSAAAPAPAAPSAPPGMGAFPFPSLDRMFGQSAAPRIGKDDLRVLMALDKKEAVPFEPVVATFSFARAVDLWNSPQFVRPKFEGFWVEETPFENGKMEMTVQDTIDGKRYTVSKIRFTLVPLAPGKLTVDPAGLLIAASPWTGPIELRTERIPLAVHPFPEKDKPADFTGLVAGGLALKSIVTPPSARAGESVTLRVTMEGNGYFKPAGPPPPPKADGAGVYDPSVKDQTFKSSGALVSRREVEYPVTLTREGRVTLPPVSVAVFDLKTRSYQRYAAEPLYITALAGDARAVEKTPLLAPRPLRAVAGELWDYGAPLHRSWGGWLIALIPPLAFAGAVIAARRRARRENDPAYARASAAYRTAQARMAEAGKAGDREELYALLDQAARGYLADRWNMPAPSLARQTARGRLEAAGHGELASQVDGMFEALEQARFASPAADDRPAALARVKETLAALERTKL